MHRQKEVGAMVKRSGGDGTKVGGGYMSSYPGSWSKDSVAYVIVFIGCSRPESRWYIGTEYWWPRGIQFHGGAVEQQNAP